SVAMGTGIGGFPDWTPEEEAEVERQPEADRRREEAEAQRAVEIENTCDSVDKTFAWALRNEMAVENQVTRISPAVQRDFSAFQKSCSEWGLPHLPAPPQAVVLFLAQASEKKHSAAHITRLRNSIDVVHRATQMPSPCDDVLVRALMRAVNEDKETD